MSPPGTDRMERKILLRAPRSRVWRALTDPLVVFELEEVAGGTMLTVVESGFDRVPLARRAQAYRMNGRAGRFR